MNAYSGNNKEKENKNNIKDEIESHNIQISKLLAQIKDENYLILIKEMLKNKEISPDKYENLLKEYGIYTQNEQYTRNSGESNSKKDSCEENDSQNINEKIKGFLESLKNKSNLDNLDDKSYKMQFIYLIFQSVSTIKDINYKAIKWVTLENNQDLYLYTIYWSLIYSLYNRIEFYINKDSKNTKLL